MFPFIFIAVFLTGNIAAERERHMLMRKSGTPTKRTLRCGWRVTQAYSPEM